MASEAVIEFTEENFEAEVMQADGPVLVDFWAPWCGPCRAIAPMIEQLASENSDKKVGKLNIDEASTIAQKYGITGIPTLLVFKNGEVEHSFRGGNTTKAALQEALDATA
ncbi:thioredoxin [Roseiconus lacunae]|uniref:Thioredoxin n=1 Tax=Roseiconus lacunae TaxID=2605694 RepID=A0ABT7PS28_9BACT|nr:thioredoxin [Roseiconus lacunae]MCD0462603.1 thioredoxin [Roseiconus lacunae]MDM4019148.1 thioredoxin [Roseiconus lacunae]WRQ49002.1 thioredoxin [Stieleria sp. HD01]